jgi:hypothetical protein
MTTLPDPSETRISFQFKKIINMTKEKPNDMELGKAVRTLIEDYNEAVKKPPFTEDYTQ